MVGEVQIKHDVDYEEWSNFSSSYYNQPFIGSDRYVITAQFVPVDGIAYKVTTNGREKKVRVRLGR